MKISKLAIASRYESLRDAGVWFHYRQLPEIIRDQADKAFDRLRNDPSHPSLRLKKVGDYYSARVSLRVRALARIRTEGMVWFWIGDHAEYIRLIRG